MEAPKKIYIDDFGSELSCDWHTKHSYARDIEYVRKDAFIEKAEEFIYSALNCGIMGIANIEDFMRLFKSIWKIRYENR